MATPTIVDDNDVKADPGQLESRVVHQIGMGKLDAAAAEGSSGQLQRSLNSRQIGMFSIAGSIGTGLLIATGSTLASGGPGSMLISMIVLGLVCYNVLAAYGEMSTAFPMDRGFSGYATRFVDPAYGCATGFNYFCKYVVLLANNLTASGLIMQYWLPHINVGVWVITFAVPIICINFCPVRVFGEVEFVSSIIKTLVIVGLMLVCLIIDLGGGPKGDRLGFRYWRDPGAFAAYKLQGSTGRFLGWWACMVNAGFVYMGTEMVGLTFGEAGKPWKVVPKAIRQTAWRISFLYIGGILVLGMVVPYNSPGLIAATKQKTGASASPFIVAIKEAGIRTLPDLINGCLLVFVLSAANSDIYIASRTLFGLARDGHLPKIFAKTHGSVPTMAVGASSLFFLLALMNTTESSSTVFKNLVSLATVFGLFNWISIMVSYLAFRRGMSAQSIPRSALPFKERWMTLRISVSLCITCIIVFFNGVTTFIPSFQVKSFVFAYTGIPVHLGLIFGAKLLLRTSRI
ncbi:dicarboxylic amino acid permease [Purpureocillium lilacinum]|uniref:Dicarboxylic amino acid permease n=1 Tax=Purpureocillium lilacinum TaxID=33203 RepID=A0A179HGM8_PURLI|nr:dicarboxylic amino acid permease [Purpureocillium lilacinum]OAQ89465.1 dicarboxylic amino acid permease [Purpureocillium lilacinum]